MDIWEQLYFKAKEQYHPAEVSPFMYAHHVVCALESENYGGLRKTGNCYLGTAAPKLVGDGTVRESVLADINSGKVYFC